MNLVEIETEIQNFNWDVIGICEEQRPEEAPFEQNNGHISFYTEKV